ncbi:MAG: leucine-rich repeat protein [Ruminococcus sp.]|nr:leucine-rich repeat protein [Ruminococcus sp.]
MKHLKRKLTAAILSVLLATSSFTAAPISVTAATIEETEAGEDIGANETEESADRVGAAENDSVGEAPTSGTTGDCTWTLDDDGTLTISGNGRMGDYYVISNLPEWGNSIKSVIIRNGVTAIGSWAFYDCDDLSSITIPDSVTTIGEHAFSLCSGLTSINIPDSVTIIGGGAFHYCTGLTSVTIPNSVITIEASAFRSCKGLTSINIPDSVTTIGKSAFESCTGLTSINIPDSVTTIGESAFASCKGLTSINIPDSVTTIGESAFVSCFGLTSVSIGTEKGINQYGTTIGTYAFVGCGNLRNLYLGENVIEIGEAAFVGCAEYSGYRLTVIIPNNTKVIKDYAFTNSRIKYVKIGNGLSRLGNGVFSECYGIESIDVQEGNDYFFTANGSLYGNEGGLFGKGELEYDKNGVVTKVYDGSDLIWYNNRNSEENITIPKGVKRIKSYALQNTDNAKYVKTNEDLKIIEDSAICIDYDRCSKVYFYLYESLESVGDIFFPNDGEIPYEYIEIYYNGTENQWNQIARNLNAYGLMVHFLDSKPVYGHLYESGNVIDGIKTEFNESWFEDNSYYNHDLARLCSEMVEMGYHAESDKKVIDLEKSLSDLGFSNLEHCNDTGRDEEDYFFASKSIKKAGEDYNLVFCGCIGSNGLQWNSDFDPKGRESSSMWWMNPVEEDFENHIGFIDARKYVYSKLSDYLKRKNYNKEKTVLLLTGHSRGAAAANLLAAKLIDDNDIVSPDNLFTYTFACPNGTCSMKRLVDYDKYDRIFNIIFPTDFVTKVFPSKWTYGRYGTTYTLPTKTNDVSYDKYKERMLDYYEKLNGSRNFSDYDNGEEEVWSIINEVQSRVGNLNNYYYYYFSFYISETYIGYANVVKETPYMFFQKGLCPVVNGEGTPTALKELIPALTMPGSLYFNIAKFFLVNAFEKTDYSILNEIGEKYDFKPRFHDAHKMETYCAFMLAMESDQVTLNRKIYKNTLNCPVDIEITEKESGEVVGRIVDNTVDEEIAAKPNSVVMTVDGDEKEFWLPGNGEYDVRLIGNDNGVMDYTVREIDPDTGETNRVNYYDVPVEKDKAYTDFFTSEKAFVITAENGSELTPDEAFNSENEVSYSVTVTAEGSGTASDSLTVPSGDYVTLTASPVESEFLGWYQNDTLVSTDLEYRFRPTEDISLTAKFTGEDLKPVEFGDVDVDGEVTISDATQIQMYLAELVELEDIQVLLSDYNLDGSVDISDATQIQLKLAELI